MAYTTKTRVPDDLLAATYKKHGRIKETAQELNLAQKTTSLRLRALGITTKCPRPVKFEVRSTIEAIIKKHGPMECHEIADHMQQAGITTTERAVSAVIRHTRRRYGTTVFRVAKWRRNVGTKGSMSPIYGLGPNKDATKPHVDRRRERAAQNKKSRQRYALLHKITRGQLPPATPFSQLFTLAA